MRGFIKLLLFSTAALLAAGACSVLAGEMDNGESYFLQKQYKRAAECYEKALKSKLNKNNQALCWFMLGQANFQQSKYTEAEKCYSKILSDFSDTGWLPEAYVGLGDINFRLKKYSDAIKHYKNSQTGNYMKRCGSLVYYKMAKTYYLLGDTKNAQEKEKAILSQYPKSLEARILMKRATPSKVASSTTTKTTTTQKTATVTPPKSNAVVKDVKGKFAVQVSYLPKESAAKSYADTLKKKGFTNAYVKNSGKGFVVLVGNYSSRQEAQKTCDKIKKLEKNDSYVVSL